MEYVERFLSFILHSQRGRDAKLLPNTTPFLAHPTPTLTLSSSACGVTPAVFSAPYTADGAGLFPTLTWSLPDTIDANTVKEYLLISEDADAPLPNPILHAGFYGIPASRTGVAAEDLEIVGEGRVKGGFRYARNRRGMVYIPPRPLRGHGEHRYFFYVVALSESLGEVEVGDRKVGALPTKEDLVRACERKVLGWGEWIGVAERK